MAREGQQPDCATWAIRLMLNIKLVNNVTPEPKCVVVSVSIKTQVQFTFKNVSTFYQGLISTPGYCKFSAWKRETEIPKQPFSRLILSSLASHSPEKYCILHHLF